MKNDVRNKIKQLALNVDLMYQIIDKKIALLIHKIETKSLGANQYQEQLRLSNLKIRELEQQISQNANKQNAMLAQNEYLKNKNISLIEEIQALNKRKPQTMTNDSSSRNVNFKT